MVGLAVAIVWLLKPKETTASLTPERVMLKPVDAVIPILENINKNIEKQYPVGEVTDENVAATETPSMLYDEKEHGLNWTSCNIINNGPNNLYVAVNSWKFPVAPIAPGQTMSVDLEARNAIKKLFFRCDRSETANALIHAVK